MGNSKNITDTGSRLLEGLSNISQQVYDNQNVDTLIENANITNRLCTGKVLKYYPHLNKALVQIDYNNQKVLCKNMLHIGGDLLLLYTPVGDRMLCEELYEPCIIPRGRLDCIVSPINSLDDEYLLLGYYLRDELIGVNPSSQGNVKLLVMGSTMEYSVRFGLDGFKIVSNGKIDKTEIDETYGETITDKDYYTRSEVDDLINQLKEELKEELTINEEDTTIVDNNIIEDNTENG